MSVPAILGNAQIAPDKPNPIAAPNPLTRTLSIFRLNMQDKITKAAEMMPESKYNYGDRRVEIDRYKGRRIAAGKEVSEGNDDSLTSDTVHVNASYT